MITQGLNYTSSPYQNNYLSPYSSYNSNKVNQTIQYSNNVVNYNNNSFFRDKTNPTNFYASNNYNTYQTITRKILPPKTYYSHKISYPLNRSYYPNNNMSYNNFIQKSYQPSYVNTAYSNNTNNNSFRTSYNVITNPINYISSKS